jgi:signal transduction histidine kinase
MLSHSAKKRMDENDTHKTYESLEKINDRTQRMVDNMNDIIWSIKPGNDSLPSVLARMREYAGTILEAKNIDCKIDFPPENTSLQLPLEFKNNVFLIFKEAINNLAKYSGATKATIKLSVTNHKFYMCITDNGKGFNNDGTITGNGGNGLLNMKRRAHELKAEFSITSKIGEGTTVEFSKKLH